MNRTIRILFSVLISVTLSGFSFGKKSLPEIETPKKVIAIIPIQKAFPGPLYLSTHPGFLTTVMRMVKEKDVSFREKIDYDPKFVPDSLHRILAGDIIKKGYNVFLADQVEPFFEQLEKSGKEFSIEQLKESITADAFLLVTIKEWDADSFDRDGSFKTSFDAVLIDSVTKKSVWSNQVVGLKLTPPSKDFLYANYQKDILRDLAYKLLKGFPKKQWEV